MKTENLNLTLGPELMLTQHLRLESAPAPHAVNASSPVLPLGGAEALPNEPDSMHSPCPHFHSPGTSRLTR